MAIFNEKVLCLFQKNNSQLEKEAKRRGIDLRVRYYNNPANYPKSQERLIAEIIYKDAYDCGRMSVKNEPCPDYNENHTETRAYRFYDVEENRTYRIMLTEDQVRLMKWLEDKNILFNYEFEEWEEPDEDVGCV